MKIYNVRISPTALADIDHLSDYLVSITSMEGAWRYKEAMRQEILSLSVFADLYQPCRSMILQRIHPKARRMLSHNRKWNYVSHIVEDMVVVDRILSSKTIAK